MTERECSRAGCRAEAVWRINWRNPRIHGLDRVKVWVSCDEHRAFFDDYLGTRGFPLVISPIDVAVEVVP